MNPLPVPLRRRCASLLFLLGVMVAAATSLLDAGEKKTKTTPPTKNAKEKKVPLIPQRGTQRFDFETRDMKGTIQLDGAYHGVTRLIDKRTGRQVIDPRYSALNLFKLQAVNQYMGQPREMKRTITVLPAAVEVKWPATEAHEGEISARYEVHDEYAVDVTVTVRSQGTYPGYELFMSHYFDKVLRPHVYLKPRSLTAPPDLIVPMVNDVFRGAVLVFPRDPLAARRCVDGRWERKEFKAPTVQMCPVRRYGYCLAFMTDPDKKLGVVLMSQPRNCYAISSRYHADKDADRPTPYSAFDLSLFGDDLVPGDERTVKVRLALTPLDRDMPQPLKLYREFIAEMRSPATHPPKAPRKE